MVTKFNVFFLIFIVIKVDCEIDLIFESPIMALIHRVNLFESNHHSMNHVLYYANLLIFVGNWIDIFNGQHFAYVRVVLPRNAPR